MRTLILLAVLVAAVTTCYADKPSGLNATVSRFVGNRLNFVDIDTGRETVLPLAPLYFYEDFLGPYFQKYVSGENTTAQWSTVETNLNTGMAVVADAVGGVLQATMDSDNNAERGVLYFGDNQAISLYYGCVFEARVQIAVATTGNTEVLIGLASDDSSTADDIATNAWFKLAVSGPTALLWETDDGTTDDDDNAAQTVAASTWYVLKIDASDTSTTREVRFYVNGSLVGSGYVAAIDLATEGKVQPYIAIQKASGTGVGTLYVDYVRVWGERQ
jgi:hypothetical protein